LTQALREGIADYLASVVSGEIPNRERNAWARRARRGNGKGSCAIGSRCLPMAIRKPIVAS